MKSKLEAYKAAIRGKPAVRMLTRETLLQYIEQRAQPGADVALRAQGCMRPPTQIQGVPCGGRGGLGLRLARPASLQRIGRHAGASLSCAARTAHGWPRQAPAAPQPQQEPKP